MATIDDIKQIAISNESVWPNDLHIGHYADQIEILDNEYDVETPAPAQLAPYITELKTAYATENSVYRLPSSSELTERIAKADEERDALVSEVKAARAYFERAASQPTKQQAAQLFGRLWDVYKPDANSAYERENKALEQWYEDYQADARYAQAAEQMGLTDTIALMMQKTQLVHQLIDQREAEQAQRPEIQLKDARLASDQAFRHVCMMISALALVDQDPDRFTVVIKRMNGKQDYYRDLFEAARRANKRVSVKSKVVGNHLYQVSAGWDWTRLIADGKAALAIDAEVFPERIVSTDKKALKAGGLVLVLDGYAVRPGDEIDVEQEYELVAPGNVLPDPQPQPEPEPEPQPDDQGGGEVTPVTPE